MNAVKSALLPASGNDGLLGGASGSDMVFGVATAGTGMFDNNCCNLTRKQRVQGFVICFCVGFLVSCLSTFSFYTGKNTQFAIFYTLGNVIALCSTGFLMGPKAQCKAMFHKKRIGATLLYLATLAGTLGLAFGVPNDANGKSFGIFACVLLQFLALVWYTASYIPFARDLIKKMVGSCFNR